MKEWTESKLWKLLKRTVLLVDKKADLTRHEDRLSIGTPDVSFGIFGRGGWTELKAYASWPRNPSSPLPFRNLKPLQRLWIKRRGRAGAPVSILVVVGGRDPEFLLFNWRAVDSLGKVTRRELYSLAVWRSVRSLDAELVPALCDPTGEHTRSLPASLRRTG